MFRLFSIALLLLALAAQPAFAEGNDLYILAPLLALNWIDYRQTSSIRHHPELRESNSILGADPSQADINKFFLAITVLYLSVYALPEPFSTAGLSWFLVVKVGTITNNHSAGLAIKF